MEYKTYLAFILTPMFGALIGYFTNWLAIKMLFRPYTKWSVTLPGFKKKLDIPFTPGLFPKEQNRLASRVAKTVTGQLLTTEDFRAITVKFVTPENVDIAVDKVVDVILKEFQNIRKLRAISEEIAQLISVFIKQSAPEIIMDATTKSPMIKDILGKAFDSIIMNLYLPRKTADNLTEHFLFHIATPNTLRTFTIQLLSDNNIEKLNKLVQDHTRGGYHLVARIITVKGILQAVRDYMEQDPGLACETIEEIIERVGLKQKISDFMVELSFKNLPYTTIDILRENFIDLMVFYITENSAKIADKFSTEEMTAILTERILKFDTSKIKPETLDSIKQEIAQFILKYLEKELGNLVEQAIPALGFEHVVFEKVSHFSPRRLEELITNISKKELAGIQVIGGVIGFFIGCLSVLVNYLVA